MLLPAPNIDERSADKVIEETRSLAPFYAAEWDAQAPQGAGYALLQNFAQLLFDVVQHLNQTPEKNFVEFLDRLNIKLEPPRSARAPVTFLLAPGTPQNVLIPSRTQTAAEATDTRPEVVFETEQNFLATIATLQAVYSIRPSDDTVFEHLSELKNPNSSELFAGKNLQEHSIYLAHSEIFNLKGKAEIKIYFIISASGLTAADFINGLSWEWWNKDHWVPSTVPAFNEALSDFPAVTTLKSHFLPTARTISVTTDVESDARFPDFGLLLIDKEIIGYTGKITNGFVGVTRGFRANQIPGASGSVEHDAGAQVTAIASPLFVNATIGTAQDGRQLVIVILKKEFDIEFTKTNVNDIENLWIRCRTLKSPALQNSPLRNLAIDTIRGSVAPPSGQTIAPDTLFQNDVPLDIPTQAKPIYPFGRQPRVFDTFYIASKDAFSKKNADITLTFNSVDDSIGTSPTPQSPEVIWEFWNSSGWVNLPLNQNDLGNFLSSSTASNKAVKFKCPSDLGTSNVNGQENFWIRARIIGGTYGTFKVVGPDVTPSFKFPKINEINISYEFVLAERKAFEQCITYNNLKYEDQTQNAQTAGTLFQPLQPPEEDKPTFYLGFDKPLVSGPIGIFFSLVKQEYLEETKPRLQWQYRNGNAWVLLDVVDDTDSLTRSGIIQLIGPADFGAREEFGKLLFWIRAVDEEKRFELPTQEKAAPLASLSAPIALPEIPGFFHFARVARLVGIPIVGFPGISLSSPLASFSTRRSAGLTVSQRLLVLRVTHGTEPSSTLLHPEKPCPELLELFHPKFSIPAELSQFPPPPILQGIFPNTVWAIQTETVRDEILGSSDGRADQKYTLMRTPVVSEEIWVNEINAIADEERKKLSEQDAKQIQEVRDEKGNLVQVWVRWRSVDDFLDSAATGRDYVMDRVFGTVQFGDGTGGMIPPIGIDNIKANYQFGGGVQGNVEAGTVISLKTSVAGVDKVTNPEAAGGGADTEVLAKALERGPQVIKHRNRAMAREDFEWLARQASNDIAKVRCLPTTNQNGEFETGWVTVMIVPQSQEAQPLPSAELIRQVKRYLADRCPNVVSAANKLIVAGPAYVEVSVTAEVFTTSIDLISQVQSETIKALKRFLHPLTGGPEGEGWDFGRLVCLSDIIAMIEALPNVDHVDNVTMQLRDMVTKTTRTITGDVLLSATLPPYAMIFSGEHNITPKFQAQG